MALIKKSLAAKQDLLLSADNTGVQQIRNGQIVTVSPINASVIPFSSTKSIADELNDKANASDVTVYVHPTTHPVSILDGTSNPDKFVKTDAVGNTGFSDVTWSDVQGKPTAFTPASHVHDMAEVTSGILDASRILETVDRKFITSTEKTSISTAEQLSHKGQPGGYVPLELDGKINSSFLGSLNVLDVFYAADEASMLALMATPGDICYRYDTEATLMLIAAPASTLANWKSINTTGVVSINGLQGIVSLSTANVPEGTQLYYTNQRVVDLVKAGTNVSLAYDSVAGTLTISANDTPVSWTEVIAKPTSIAGYGITDAYTKTEIQTVLPKVGFDLLNVTAPGTGQLAWNHDERTLDLGLNGVTLQMGQEMFMYVRNNTASTIANKTVCMYSGTIGNSGRITIAPCDASSADMLVGVATEDIPAGADGYITYFGKVRGVDTRAWTEGDILYVAPGGQLTKIAPTTGVKMPIAVVISSSVAGTLFVRISNLNENAYEAANPNIQAHIANLANPHSVTKAQVGLSNVNNTSDANKPVSTAQAAAIATKADRATTYTKTEVDTLVSQSCRTAAYVPNVPAGNIAATNVQDALNELDNDKVPKVASTDNAIARFNGTTGTLQDSSVTIDDSGNVGNGTQSFNGFGGSGFKNYIINGGFDVWQRGTSNLSVTNGLIGVYADMWRYANTTGQGTLTLSNSTLTYNGVAYKSLKATVSSALSLSPGVAYAHYTSIEDKNSYMLRGKEFVISFLMEVNYAGNYSFSIRKVNDDGGVTTSFLKLIPCVVGVNKIEIKVPANNEYISPSSAFGRGLNISIGTFVQVDTSTVEGWQSGNLSSIASAYKWITQVGAYINIAQFQLEEGSVATPFEQRPIGLELNLCQRYCRKIGGEVNATNIGLACMINNTLTRTVLSFNCHMRVAPSFSYYGNLNNYTVGGITGSTLQASQASSHHVLIDLALNTARTEGDAFPLRFATTNEYFILSAEL